MTTYYDGCILGIKCMDKKVVLPFLAVMVTSNVT